MKTLHLVQGTPEWHAHRAQHFNASDAPAMLGCSPYKTRAQLVREVATGIGADVDAATQARFDAGHRYEALARPLAEKLIGEELFPCVGVADGSPHSASFDGLTLMGDTAFEHKTLNDELRQAIHPDNSINAIPKHYRVQMEQQCMVSGAERVLFMASKWNGADLVEERHCWYYPDPDLRAEILAGWEQFAADVAGYVPEVAPAPAAVGRTPESLPALSVVARGMVEFSNLAEFREKALAAIAAVNRDLKTDDDFATAELTVKAFKTGEEKLEATKAQVLGQMADVDAVMRTIDEVSAQMRAVRLELDKLVTREKEARRAEIVQKGVAGVREHYAAVNATLGPHALAVPASLVADMGAAIKGKKSLTSMRDAVDAAVAATKIAASQQADRVRANVAILAEQPEDVQMLFADRVQLCATKATDDLRNLIAARVAEHRNRESKRLEAERIERAQQIPAAGVPAAQQPLDGAANNAGVATGSRNAPPSESVTRGSLSPAPLPSKRIKLGDINGWIAPLSITADGLASLGFKPVGTERAAKLYSANDFPRICQALATVIAQAPARASEKEAA